MAASADLGAEVDGRRANESTMTEEAGGVEEEDESVSDRAGREERLWKSEVAASLVGEWRSVSEPEN